ncbi:MAG: hypothetical protein ABSB42_00310 [Tepidisphaeraceae bacterium]|jgi:hypothetical protein
MIETVCKTAAKSLRLVMLAGALGALAACTLAGAVADKAVTPTVNAKYVPNKKDSMLVLVESYNLSLDSGIESQHMALTLGRSLRDDKIATTIDPQNLERLRDADPDQYRKMSIAEIGRRVGARQVLYVHIWRAEIVKPPGAGQMRGHIEAIVKVVDSATGDTRWPTDASSEAVQITTAWIPDSSGTTDADLRARMADQMAQDIGRLFHDYHPDEDEPTPKINLD